MDTISSRVVSYYTLPKLTIKNIRYFTSSNNGELDMRKKWTRRIFQAVNEANKKQNKYSAEL